MGLLVANSVLSESLFTFSVLRDGADTWDSLWADDAELVDTQSEAAERLAGVAEVVARALAVAFAATGARRSAIDGR